MIIYKATNTTNGMSYIGQTTRDVDARIAEHTYKMNAGSNSQFHNALRKYGVDSFSWTILDTADDIDELNLLEAFYIDKFDTFDSGYNLTTGGMNHIVSEETKQKMSKSLSGENHPFFGKTHSEETRQKMRENSKGWKSGKPPMLGKTHSKRTRALMSRNRPDQSGDKNPNYGRTTSEETKAKQRRQVTCPHCNKTGGLTGMKSWHFDNCKLLKQT